MFDIHSNQTVYLEKPELVLPERKGNRGPQHKRLTVMEKGTKVSEYIQGLDCEEWEEMLIERRRNCLILRNYRFCQKET